MDLQKELAQVVAKAWSDPQFKEQLMKNPEKVLKELGFFIPEGKQIKICEDTDSILHLVLPEKPKGEFSMEELEFMTAGASDPRHRRVREPEWPQKGTRAQDAE